MVFKICEEMLCSSFSVKELDVIVHKKYFPCITNLVVDVGTRHKYQTLLDAFRPLCVEKLLMYKYISMFSAKNSTGHYSTRDVY